MTPKDAQRVIDATPEELAAGGKDYGVLKRFMREHFPITELCKAGFFAPEIKNDYYKQAVRVCKYFGYQSVFQYGAEKISGHITYVDGKRPPGEGFITVIESIY